MSTSSDSISVGHTSAESSSLPHSTAPQANVNSDRNAAMVSKPSEKIGDPLKGINTAGSGTMKANIESSHNLSSKTGGVDSDDLFSGASGEDVGSSTAVHVGATSSSASGTAVLPSPSGKDFVGASTESVKTSGAAPGVSAVASLVSSHSNHRGGRPSNGGSSSRDSDDVTVVIGGASASASVPSAQSVDIITRTGAGGAVRTENSNFGIQQELASVANSGKPPLPSGEGPRGSAGGSGANPARRGPSVAGPSSSSSDDDDNVPAAAAVSVSGSGARFESSPTHQQQHDVTMASAHRTGSAAPVSVTAAAGTSIQQSRILPSFSTNIDGSDSLMDDVNSSQEYPGGKSRAAAAPIGVREGSSGAGYGRTAGVHSTTAYPSRHPTQRDLVGASYDSYSDSWEQGGAGDNSYSYSAGDSWEQPGTMHRPAERSGGQYYSDDVQDLYTSPGSSTGSSPRSPRPRDTKDRDNGRPISRGGAAPVETMRSRLEAAVMEALQRHPSLWDVKDVCNWVEVLGFMQYRRKFSHNCVDGTLLLKLTDAQLKRELGILPLGHRVALLEAVDRLKEGAPSPLDQDVRKASPDRGSPRVMPALASPNLIPPEPYLGPASGKMTAYEQRAKLLYELDRATNKAAQHGAVINQLERVKHLTEEEVGRLRGKLKAVERDHKVLARRSHVAHDPSSPIPWKPNNGWMEESHPGRLARPGDDPNLDLTFKPRITNHRMENERKSFFKRTEIFFEKDRKLKEEIDDLAKEDDLKSRGEELGDGTARRRDRKGLPQYWIPGGEGVNHKLPPAARGRLPPNKLDVDKKALVNAFIRWQYDPVDDDPDIGKQGDKGLLKAIDRLVDAILTPWQEARGYGGFTLRVKTFFRENNMNLEPPKAGAPRDPLIEKLRRLKGMEEISDLDKARIERRGLRLPEKKRPSIQAVEMKKQATKIHIAAGLLRMADWMGKRLGRARNKKDESEGSEEDTDDDHRKKGANRKPAGKDKMGKGARQPLDGPWISNGHLQRTHPKSLEYNTISRRLELSRKKMNIQTVTVEAGKLSTAARSAKLDEEVEKADEMYRLMGWKEGGTVSLLNQLLRRASHVAEMRAEDLHTMVEVKTEMIRTIHDLQRMLTRIPPKTAEYKELSLEIADRKHDLQQHMAQPLPEVPWDDLNFQDDLDALQEEELQARQQELERRYQHRRVSRHHQQGADHGEHTDNQFMIMATLPECVRLLSQLSVKELKALRRIGSPKGEEDLEEGSGAGRAGAGLAGVQVYDEEDQSNVEGDQRLKVEAIKALKRKKVAVHRAICEMRFVEESEKYVKDRERRLNQEWLLYVGAPRPDASAETTSRGASRSPSPPKGSAGRPGSGFITSKVHHGRGATTERGSGSRPVSARRKESKDEFFQRLRDDMDRRNRDLEERMRAKDKQEQAQLRDFRARPFDMTRPYAGPFVDTLSNIFRNQEDNSFYFGDQGRPPGTTTSAAATQGAADRKVERPLLQVRTGGGFHLFRPRELDHWFDSQQAAEERRQRQRQARSEGGSAGGVMRGQQQQQRSIMPTGAPLRSRAVPAGAQEPPSAATVASIIPPPAVDSKPSAALDVNRQASPQRGVSAAPLSRQASAMREEAVVSQQVPSAMSRQASRKEAAESYSHSTAGMLRQASRREHPQ
ncbi:hypothetical protein CEUSTIGMA_g1124.t1 [Chlamydomonas eustigma]|uniref:SAM domain-containing protein n=1 Tax=Chlamydomonas eustigma TaxID=1157962 RepID=A0A250WS66_9CHLO|nr:hypothetical protein CEUSTIGMA_g1124.t1 [Chlamydomonas eustigma]|eukprot:GAX73673.1 hypothetical protein CEUSTIGMA_g1124.t1 [Chlamydomonas eustigma]